jgi:hypothetical protein
MATRAHQPCSHGSEEFRTTNGNALEFERTTASQTLALHISHDIRHHLASIYCTIEFMSDSDICQTDREQLLAVDCRLQNKQRVSMEVA